MIDPSARVVDCSFSYPIYIGRNVRIGPQVRTGKYFLINEDSHFAHGTIGSFCSVGSRCCLNAQNHPTDWLSTHGFQYHRGIPFSNDKEYCEIKPLSRPIESVTIGNDVWISNHVNIISGVTVGDGAILAAGAIVTKNVPPYAIVGGNPAKIIRYRFDESTIERFLRLKWWELDLAMLNGLPFNEIDRCLDRLEGIRNGSFCQSSQ